jgi:hypothetical protein
MTNQREAKAKLQRSEFHKPYSNYICPQIVQCLLW